jgi:fluoride ion exporter CrcB/FEX
MTNQLLWILISAISGGMIRGIVGVAKSLWPNKKQEFKLDYFLFNLLLSAFIGAIAGILTAGSEEMTTLATHTNKIAFLAGYAGPDFIESLFKLKFGQIFED